MDLSDFHFLRPLWLWLVLPLAVLLWQLMRRGGERDAWHGLVDAHLLPSLMVEGGGRSRSLPIALLAIAWLLGVLALAGPTWERLPQPSFRAEQYRVIALDLSTSMNVNDLAPSRLVRARYKVLDLLRAADEGQTALLAYGAEPYIVSPLTADVDTIAAQVSSLETGLLPLQGGKRTDLALGKAGDLLAQAGAPHGQVILVTDGLNNSAAAREAAAALHDQGYRVAVLGVGTDDGAPVPRTDGSLATGADGAVRMSRLERDALQRLADAGGGRYVTVRADGRDIQALLSSSFRPTQGTQEDDALTEQWREAGPWLLLLVLPLAALAFRRGWVSPLLVLVLVQPTQEVQALTWDDLWARPDQQAARRLDAGKPAEAADLFERADWRAAAQYRAGDYAQALESLGAHADADSAYNRGNALARLGRLEDAVNAYDHALEIDPDDADARHNRDLVQALLDRQRQAQQSSGGQQGEQDGDSSQSEQGQPGQPTQNGSPRQAGESSQQAEQSPGDDTGQKDQQAQASRDGGESEREQAEQRAEQGQEGESGQQAAPGQVGLQDQQAQAGQQNQPGKQGEDKQVSGQADEPGQHAEQGQAGQSEEENGQRGQQDRRAQKGQQDDVPTAGGPRDNRPAGSSPPAPGLADLMGSGRPAEGRPRPGPAPAGDAERSQAIEHMLRRVEDDPAGLLRQRFLLQHLRRRGQL